MKTVFSPQDVAHKFAHQLQSEARNSGNTLFFENDRIYSYGKHFCIARFKTNEIGEKALLFTTRGYSNTTAKHISIVRSATNHLNVIFCNDPNDSATLNIEAFENNIKNALTGILNARKPEKYIDAAEYVFNQLEKYCAFFGLSIPADAIELIESAKTGQYKEYLAKEAIRIENEKKEAQLRAVQQFKKQLTKWRKGEGRLLYNRPLDRDYLRYNGKRIQTSQGIEIPLEIGKRVYNRILKTVKTGGCFGECDFKVLDFDVKEVTAKLITVGCHKIEMTEINKIAKQLNW